MAISLSVCPVPTWNRAIGGEKTNTKIHKKQHVWRTNNTPSRCYLVSPTTMYLELHHARSRVSVFTRKRRLNRVFKHYIYVWFISRQKADIPTPKHRWQLTTWQVSLSSKEEISWSGIEPTTSSLRFGYLSTIFK